ncbi:MAG: amidohydrolase family protein [Acidimicrobiia bacterium]
MAGRVPLPVLLQRRSTDEYAPVPLGEHDRRVRTRVAEQVDAGAAALKRSPSLYATSRLGTAAGLLALNAEFGDDYYRVPPEATLDADAAESALGGDQLLVDVQTHYVAGRPDNAQLQEWTMQMYRSLAPSWWDGIDGMVVYDFAEYLRCVFVESDVDVAVLTSNPGVDERRMLFNPELAGSRELVDRLAGTGRLLNHAVVHPNHGETAQMEDWRDRFRPVGWKVYTLGKLVDGEWVSTWRLDDDDGHRFLDEAERLAVPLVCAHKGIAFHAAAGSPDDVGPAARAHPNVDFVIYHSGYEMPDEAGPNEDGEVEGPFRETTADIGVNRLITTMRDHGLGPGDNVSAELGTTWFCLVRRPDAAAHVLGKLMRAFGEDNIIWGTDSVWYGPNRPVVDAFRAFQIPERMQEEFGYPALTPRVKEKILGLNASRLYGIDTAAARGRRGRDDLGWISAARAEFERTGVPISG